ncbi:MAG: hypothetical protein ACK5MR_10255 [Cumulibacter sp.]
MTVYAKSGTPIHFKNVKKAQLIDGLRLIIDYGEEGENNVAVFYRTDYMGIGFDNKFDPTMETYDEVRERIKREISGRACSNPVSPEAKAEYLKLKEDNLNEVCTFGQEEGEKND